MKRLITLLITLLCITYLSATELQTQALYSNDHHLLAYQDPSQIHRSYPQKDTLQPLMGYITTEERYNFGISVLLQKIYALDVDSVTLTIDLSLQQRVEEILDEYKAFLKADEILVAVMESGTGKVRAMASSNRYDPNEVTKVDFLKMHQKFSIYAYEPGAVIMPLILSAALERRFIERNSLITTHNGRMALDNGSFITDATPTTMLTPEGILLNMSNIGIAKVAYLFSGYEFEESLRAFGFGDYTKIELHYGRNGNFPTLQKLTERIYRANTSYGYGMSATFVQLIQAYSAFNNDGQRVTPTLIDSLYAKEDNLSSFSWTIAAPVEVISKETAQVIHKMLISNVHKGFAKQASLQGLETGGMGSTAYITKGGRYVREYHSSFYGFANDVVGNRYTIGVLVIKPKDPQNFDASRSAVPVFRKVVEVLEEEHFLSPSK
jgi:cell division protein FtsI (penicillin-binding protein 3)